MGRMTPSLYLIPISALHSQLTEVLIRPCWVYMLGLERVYLLSATQQRWPTALPFNLTEISRARIFLLLHGCVFHICSKLAKFGSAYSLLPLAMSCFGCWVKKRFLRPAAPSNLTRSCTNIFLWSKRCWSVCLRLMDGYMARENFLAAILCSVYHITM